MQGTKDIFDRFAQRMMQFPYQYPCVVAVSGGSDSMALALLMHQFLSVTLGNNFSMIAVTIDHQQRCRSNEEAQWVHQCLTQRGICHRILTWNHGPLVSRVEEQGRLARYQLLTEFCQTFNYSTVYTAHHAEDQIETFLMRLKRGCGLSGLSAIRPIRLLCEAPKIQLIRPLLNFFPNELKEFLKSQNQDFVHDPCNDNEAYERCQIRNQKGILHQLGLREKALLSTITQLQEVDFYIQKAAQIFIDTMIPLNFFNQVQFSLSQFQILMPPVAKQVLKQILEKISLKELSCPQRLLDNLYIKIMNHQRTTAHGCFIRYKQGTLIIEKEPHRNHR